MTFPRLFPEPILKKFCRTGIWTLVLGFFLGVISALSVRAGAETEINTLSCGFFDLGSYSAGDREKSALILSQLRSLEADILVLAGLRDIAAAESLAKALDCPFSAIVEAADPERRLALLARIEPLEFKARNDLSYQIDDAEIPVRRGFIQALFKVGDYELYVLGADLKNRDKHPVYNQTDMRRYEARQLRYLATEIILKHMKDKELEAANLLILGRLNDSCGMNTVTTVYNRRFGIDKRLFDLRPLDTVNSSWTYWNRADDVYERIDYAIASSGLVPEILREHSFVQHQPGWKAISDHRPVLVTIFCSDAPEWPKARFDAIFPNAIYEHRKLDEEAKLIGERRKRNPPQSRN